MMMLHLFLIRRYDVAAIHYVTPTDDNHRLAQYMEKVGIFASVGDEVGEIIVADVDRDWVSDFLAAEEGIGALFSGYPTDG